MLLNSVTECVKDKWYLQMNNVIFYMLHSRIAQTNFIYIFTYIHGSKTIKCPTFVDFISWFQCLSLIAGFCSSPTALNDVKVFLTVASNPVYVSQTRISLSNILISFANFLHSISMFSTSIFLHGVVFQSSTQVCTV